MVLFYNMNVLNTYFPSLPPATAAQMDQLFRTFVPPYVNISLDRVVPYLPKPESVKSVELNNTPPAYLRQLRPAILLSIDGQPVFADLPHTNLKSAVNTTWPLFQDKSNSQYYLLVNNIWLTASDLQGPWSRTMKVPDDFKKLPNSGKFAEVLKAVPPPQVSNPVIPGVFYATSPAEVILFDGQPTYTPIAGTQLSFANNTDSPLFVYSATQTYYYLAAGRWFSAPSLQGPWTFASLSLPADFANIPLTSPASAILASVPGTNEAKDAVLIAQIPTTMILNPTTAAAQAKVSYSGPPEFAPITGTSLQYATNTVDKVIQVGDVYYLCLQGVWFMSTTPNGPWTTASSVPQVIYTIPPSSPVYNVTYVTQTTTSDGNISASYTAGYLGAFVMGAAVGAIICSGTGYYYPPYIGYPPMGYPVLPSLLPHRMATRLWHSLLQHQTGAYGYSVPLMVHTARQQRPLNTIPIQAPMHAALPLPLPTGARASAKRTILTPEHTAPHIRARVRQHSGANPTYSREINLLTLSTIPRPRHGRPQPRFARGKRLWPPLLHTAIPTRGKNSSGDMYAGHDGNVYQNTGGSWQKYDNSTNSWNSVNTQQAQQEAQQKSQSYQQQHPDSQANMQQHEQSFNSQSMNSDMQNRMSGASSSDHYNQYHPSGSGGWGWWWQS